MVSRGGAQAEEAEWFLDVGGARTGPFSAEQVLGFLAEGEIPENQKVTGDSIGNRWITAREFAARAREGQAATDRSASELGFTPPPRPADLDRPGPAPDRSQHDTAKNLFEALQTAKERQGTSWTPPEAAHWAKTPWPSLGFLKLRQRLRKIKMTPELRRQI